MRTWIILILLVAAAVAAYVVLSPEAQTPTVPEEEQPAAGPSGDTEGGGDAVLRTAPPEQRPELEAFRLEEPVNVLFLTGLAGRVPVFLARQCWESDPKIHVVSWVSPSAAPGAGEGAPTPDVLPNPLGRRPGITTLSDEEIDVVAVHDMDPGVLDDDFWIEVAKSVEEGRIGLLLMPGVLEGAKMVEHPVLRTLLPVDEAGKVEGTPPAGTFVGLAHFKVTEAGEKHPATRLVPWPTWSQRIWQSTRTLETPWGTPFSYPVKTLREGAATLVWAEPERGDAIPALIVGAPEQGRVLWAGNADFGVRQAYGRPDVTRDWQILVRNWIAWLAGRVKDTE